MFTRPYSLSVTCAIFSHPPPATILSQIPQQARYFRHSTNTLHHSPLFHVRFRAHTRRRTCKQAKPIPREPIIVVCRPFGFPVVRHQRTTGTTAPLHCTTAFFPFFPFFRTRKGFISPWSLVGQVSPYLLRSETDQGTPWANTGPSGSR